MLIPKTKFYKEKRCVEDWESISTYSRFEYCKDSAGYCIPKSVKYLYQHKLSPNSKVFVGNICEVTRHDTGLAVWDSYKFKIGSAIEVFIGLKPHYFEYLGTQAEKLDKGTVLKLAKALELLYKEEAIAKVISKKTISQIKERKQKIIGLFANGVSSEEDIKNVLTEKEYVAVCKFAKKIVAEKERV